MEDKLLGILMGIGIGVSFASFWYERKFKQLLKAHIDILKSQHDMYKIIFKINEKEKELLRMN